MKRTVSVTLRFQGVASCDSQDELDIRIESLTEKAEWYVKKAINEGLNGKAKIVCIDAEFSPEKPINRQPLECRLTVVLAGEDDLRYAVCDYVGNGLLQDCYMMFRECKEVR